MKHTSNRKKVASIITSKGPSVTGLNCRLLISFDGQMKYVLGIYIIRSIDNVVTIHRIHGILTGRSDGNEWRGGTVGTGFDGGTGPYGQVLTGRDGRSRFCRRDGTVRGYFLDGTGR